MGVAVMVPIVMLNSEYLGCLVRFGSDRANIEKFRYLASELFEHPQGQPHGIIELHVLDRLRVA